MESNSNPSPEQISHLGPQLVQFGIARDYETGEPGHIELVDPNGNIKPGDGVGITDEVTGRHITGMVVTGVMSRN